MNNKFAIYTRILQYIATFRECYQVMRKDRNLAVYGNWMKLVGIIVGEMSKKKKRQTSDELTHNQSMKKISKEQINENISENKP